LENPASFEFRKSYVTQRLHYILDHLPTPDAAIWDCGCGYGTTAIFLALNGYKVHGTTLEFYFSTFRRGCNTGRSSATYPASPTATKTCSTRPGAGILRPRHHSGHAAPP
jgi:hypothetical protein